MGEDYHHRIARRERLHEFAERVAVGDFVAIAEKGNFVVAEGSLYEVHEADALVGLFVGDKDLAGLALLRVDGSGEEVAEERRGIDPFGRSHALGLLVRLGQKIAIFGRFTRYFRHSRGD
jgi:hypothetical protein